MANKLSAAPASAGCVVDALQEPRSVYLRHNCGILLDRSLGRGTNNVIGMAMVHDLARPRDTVGPYGSNSPILTSSHEPTQPNITLRSEISTCTSFQPLETIWSHEKNVETHSAAPRAGAGITLMMCTARLLTLRSNLNSLLSPSRPSPLFSPTSLPSSFLALCFSVLSSLCRTPTDRPRTCGPCPYFLSFSDPVCPFLSHLGDIHSQLLWAGFIRRRMKLL